MWMWWYDLWSRKKLPDWPHMPLWHWWITWRQPIKLSLNRVYVTIDQGNNLKSDVRDYKNTTLTIEGYKRLSFSLWRMWRCVWSFKMYKKYWWGSNLHISYIVEDVVPNGDCILAWLHLRRDRNADFNIQGDSIFLCISFTCCWS